MDISKLSAEELLEMKQKLQGEIELPNLTNLDINDKNFILDIDNKNFAKNIIDPVINNEVNTLKNITELENLELPKLKEIGDFKLPEDISNLALTEEEIEEYRRSR